MLANTSTPKDRNLTVKEPSTSNSKESEVKKDGGSKTKVTLRERQPERVKELERAKTIPTPKKIVHKTPKKENTDNQYVDKVVAKKVPSHTKSTEAKVRAGYYIKVGAFKDTSTAVEKIKKTGLNYSLIKTKNDTTVTRVLIGPFKSNWGAQQHLPSVKNNIAEGAYITRIN
jgi:cell division protein FtsN